MDIFSEEIAPMFKEYGILREWVAEEKEEYFATGCVKCYMTTVDAEGVFNGPMDAVCWDFPLLLSKTGRN